MGTAILCVCVCALFSLFFLPCCAEQIYSQAPLLNLGELGSEGGVRISLLYGHPKSTRVRTKVLVWWDVEIWEKGKVYSGSHYQRVVRVGERTTETVRVGQSHPPHIHP